MQITVGKFLLFISIYTLALNANADWLCYTTDQGGHFWSSTGQTPERANAVAMSFCSSYSSNGSSCQLSKCVENNRIGY